MEHIANDENMEEESYAEEKRKRFKKLDQRIGSKRLDEILELSQKKVSKTDWGVTELKKWLKKQFPTELTYEDARIIGWRVCYPDSDQEEERQEVQLTSENENKTIHKKIVDALLKIGVLKGYQTDSPFTYDNFQYDVIWKKIHVHGVNPYCVFEIQVKGNLTQALTKLKHANDVWNSRIYLVSDQLNIIKTRNLLEGAFHEIKDRIKLVLLDRVTEILRLLEKLKEIDDLA